MLLLMSCSGLRNLLLELGVIHEKLLTNFGDSKPAIHTSSNHAFHERVLRLRDDGYLSLFLNVADSESLPHGWKRHIKSRLTVVNQITEKLSHQEVMVEPDWFDQKRTTWGSPKMLPLTKLHDKNGGFLVNGEAKIVAEVGVLEVIGKSDVLEETLLVNESSDVNGFQVLPSHVESVNKLFKKYPDIASKIRSKNPLVRTMYLNSILSLTDILSQSPEKLSIDDLANAYSTLSYVKKAGFKLDWLEKKLKEVGETRVQEMEDELKNMKALLGFLG